MQATAQALRDQLWTKLKVVFDKYAEGKPEIPTSSVEKIVSEALGEQTQQEIDYVVKNMFRLDQDQSGTVSFLEFGNFLFKRHCGQMSLQKHHKEGKMKKGSERKMSLEEFNILMNNAYKFLAVTCPPDVAKTIFTAEDKDQDGLITYVEYFHIIDTYICKSEKGEQVPVPEPPKPVDLGPERHSRLRIHLWTQLRKLYEHYVQGRSLAVTDVELRKLLFSIVGELSETELSFISTNLLSLNYKTIEFDPFASNFIYIMAELGLSRYSRNNPSTKKTLNKEEFVVLFRNSFKFLNVAKIKDDLLFKIFAKIDKNNDGLISFEEYLDWVKRFLAVLKYFGTEFWVDEDDYDKYGDAVEKEPVVEIPHAQTREVQGKFVFSDYTLAKQVRERVLTLLIPFDQNKDKLFDEKQIHTALIQLLKENEYELAYVTKNVFRYDRDGDKNVTYDQLTNFCVEQHFGQMAIQRLHRKKTYARGAERIMNEQQFGLTLNYALDFIQLKATEAQIHTLFSEIDLDKDGWISYEVYFLFLKYYFGSLSLAAGEIKPIEKPVLSEDEEFLNSLAGLSEWDRFWRIYYDQLRIIFMRFDLNKNLVFEPEEIEQILAQVFNLNANEIDYIMHTFFMFDTRKQKHCTFEELIAIILSVYFIELVIKRRYQSKDNQTWKTRKISLEEFIKLFNEESFFIRVKVPRKDLIFIFENLDTDKDGFITFEQYIAFIKQHLGKGLELVARPKEEKPAPVDGISAEELAFIEAIWGELKKWFDKYDNGAKGYLNDAELKKFAIEVLNESSQRELDYIFWNLFRVDPNGNKQVDFSEFAPFILNHAGEISLQRFHREQTKGKSSLSEGELFIVMGNAYKFLSSMPKQEGVIKIIHKRIAKDGVVTYAGFLNWVHHNLSTRVK